MCAVEHLRSGGAVGPSRPRPAMHVLLPSETQVREFDPKLLLACVLAERGARCVVGSRIHMHLEIDALPRGLYLAKDVRHSSDRMFRILGRLGFDIAALDEEGLLTLPPEGYYAQRVSRESLSQVGTFFAWGEVHAAAMRGAPGAAALDVLPAGNPRFDLLRPELRGFYEAEAAALRARHGEFVLINSNFGRANPRVRVAGAPPAVEAAPDGPGARLIRDYFGFRDRLFPLFAAAVPKLANALPDARFVLRPHPGENFDTWREICRGVPNIEVVHEGYIAPWLLAARAVLHNGCTTGIEAHVVDTRCVAYRPLRAAGLEIELPNLLGAEADDFDALVDCVRAALERGPRSWTAGPEVRAEMLRHIAGLDGAFASERMAEAIMGLAGRAGARRSPFLRLVGRGEAMVRRLEKNAKAWIPNHKNSRAYTRQRFPGVSLEEAREKVARFGRILGRFGRVEVAPIAPYLHEVRLSA